MLEKYSLGLDIGTNSIGWAVVDENNEIVKKNNFALWGVRMFEASSDASEKRSNRNSRRRLQRRKQPNDMHPSLCLLCLLQARKKKKGLMNVRNAKHLPEQFVR